MGGAWETAKSHKFMISETSNITNENTTQNNGLKFMPKGYTCTIQISKRRIGLQVILISKISENREQISVDVIVIDQADQVVAALHLSKWQACMLNERTSTVFSKQ